MDKLLSEIGTGSIQYRATSEASSHVTHSALVVYEVNSEEDKGKEKND